MRFFLTGGAGFIGSNLADRLLALGHPVTVYDNFSSGQWDFLQAARTNPGFHAVQGDLLDEPALRAAMKNHDFVFHLTDPVGQSAVATVNVLEAMRGNDIRRLAFSPAPETEATPIPSRPASEGLVSAYVTGHAFQGYVFRFASILGERYTRGPVFDFYEKLLVDPHQVEVPGDGRQRESYLYVQDCIDAMLTVLGKARDPLNVYTLGSTEHCSLDDSLGWICAHLGVNPRRVYGGPTADAPVPPLDATKVRNLGWRPKLSIREAIQRTLKYLQQDRWVQDHRRASA